MEAYKSTCPDCKAVYYWTGLKTSWNEKQAKTLEAQQGICKKCGSKNLKTELDHESPAGKDLDGMYHEVIQSIFG